MEDTFRGEVWEKSNGQKVVTIPTDTDIETGQTVRVAGLGKYPDMMTPENAPGHYVHDELKAINSILIDANSDIPENDMRKLNEEYNYMELVEYDIADALKQMKQGLNKRFAVMDENDSSGRQKVFFRHEVKHLADQLSKLERVKNHELEDLQDELGIEKARWGRTVTICWKEKGEETYELRTDDEDAREFLDRHSEIQDRHEESKKDLIEEEGFDWSMEAKSRSSAVYKLEKNGFRTEIPAYGAVNVEKKSIDVEVVN